MITRIAWYPSAATAAYVLSAFGDGAEPVSWLVRPLGVALLATLLIQLVASLLSRSPQRGAMLAGAAVLVFANAFGVVLIGALVVGWLRLARSLGVRSVPALPSLGSTTRALNIATAVLLVTTAIPLAPRVATMTASSVPSGAPGTSARPDIFFLLLDGYPRGDTLSTWGFDNEPFLKALEARGFDVDRKALGSYTQTYQALAALFQMRQIPDLDINVPTSQFAQGRLVNSLINHGPALAILRDLGYQIVTVPPAAATTALTSADVYVDDGSITSLEQRLIARSNVGTLLSLAAPTFLHDQHAARIEASLRHLGELGQQDSETPRFVFAHIVSPHMPFVFRADGSRAPAPACYPAECAFHGGAFDEVGLSMGEGAELYTNQIRYLNGLVLEALDDVLDDPDAIVLVMSDHGARYSYDDMDEWFRVLFAARTPAATAQIEFMPLHAGVFPALFNAYFNYTIPTPRSGEWVHRDVWPLDLEPYVGQEVAPP